MITEEIKAMSAMFFFSPNVFKKPVKFLFKSYRRSLCWLRYVYSEATVKIPCSYRMATVWLPLATVWLPYGYHVATVGYRVATVWLQCGYRWLPCGYRVATVAILWTD
ncbi:hypothetical protein PoB_006866300 [Plakobranchus ocellatus]|uniref:Uncharacterized protein n=1 Tax=Plakobranchus ocellatus TaxID=259542 RepID=A0AAV4DDM3_9GAST|nr:hypothetical protein PoB_006866300 [Plakobranchus ocellatus]